MKIGLLGLLTSAVLVFLSACADRPGGGYAGVADTPAVTKSEATKVKLKSQLVRTTLIPPEEAKKEIYRITGVHFGADAKAHIISAEIKIVSSAGAETIRLAGKIRENGSATLLDVSPRKNPRTTNDDHRMMAEAYCEDLEECNSIILNIWYKVADELVKRQFVSESLEKENHAPVMPGAPKKPDPSPTQPIDPVDNSEDDEINETEPDIVWGEFVGAPRNEEFVENLWERPLVPESIPDPVVESAPELPEQVDLEKPKPEAIDGVATDSNEIPRPSPRPMTEKEEKAEFVALAKAAARAREEITKGKAKAEVNANLAAKREAELKKSATEREQSTAKEKAEKQRAEDERKALEAKQTAEELRKHTQAQMKEVEARLSPFLELSSGGMASGFYSKQGTISNSSALPMSGNGFQRLNKSRGSFYGAGIMISLITKLAGEFVTKYFPGSVIYLGDISEKNGGHLIGSKHSSHQNGLDADIAFIGNTSFTSVIKGGGMNPNFHYAKNWQFWRLVAGQQIVQDNKRVSVLTQIYVNPVVKRGLCSWAKTHNILSNPLDAELMRRLRAWQGHDKHFHLRIRCSPYYPTCRNQGDPAPGTGCSHGDD